VQALETRYHCGGLCTPAPPVFTATSIVDVETPRDHCAPFVVDECVSIIQRLGACWFALAVLLIALSALEVCAPRAPRRVQSHDSRPLLKDLGWEFGSSSWDLDSLD
jgi:hypothetical protein